MRVRFARHATFEFGPLSRREPETTPAEAAIRTCNTLPGAQEVVAVHLEAIDHCLLTREGPTGRVETPAAGETLEVP